MNSRIQLRAAATISAVGLCLSLGTAANATKPNEDGIHKWWVCKYVGKPGVDERLKGGKNPIAVDDAAIAEAGWFADAQHRSYAITRVVPGEEAPPTSRCGWIEQ